MDFQPTKSSDRRPRLLRLAGFAVLTVMVVGVAGAAAQDLQSEVSEKRAALEHAEQREGVLTSQISRYNSQISKLEGEVAALRNREAAVAAELAEKEAELDNAHEELMALRKRLRYSVRMLSERLVAIYKSDEPDALSVILEADGFEELLDRTEYLGAIEGQDSELVDSVRELRDTTSNTVARIRDARDVIAAKKRELERTRAQLESQEAELATARGQRQTALGGVEGHIDRLEGDIAGLEDKIQAQLAAAAAAAAPAGGAPAPLPAGPIVGGSGGMIWPVNGTLTSPFGMRWGRLHAGIDIAAPGGTPIRAAKAGNVVLASVYGGYGNYTCVDHGGGLSTCYAHQSAYEVTSGSVSQGQVIGYVGNTGASYGDHLHFEVRVNGVPTDPMGYL